MDHYQGQTNIDPIRGGGAFVEEHGFGFEVFNFQEFCGSFFGYVQPPGRKGKWQEARIGLEKLGGSNRDASVSGVLVIWVATEKSGASPVVVGWFRNATVFRTCQPAPHGSQRSIADQDCAYYVTTRTSDAKLLPRDERVFQVPRGGEGSFGQSNIWYANHPDHNRQFRLDVLDYIETRRRRIDHNNERAIQSDPFLRQKIERIAIDLTCKRFNQLGYTVQSVERDNLGWDLEASQASRLLRLEVKGLSGNQLTIELTPNEYTAMQSYRESYRLCVVTNALTTPSLEVFAYSPDSGQWENDGRTVLRVAERVGARCSA
jgi:hypothetical protein